jgi:tRNA threonylcarbamoyladenosine biosynthesis protein TsaB
VKVVAVETATSASSVALGEDGRVVASARRADRRGHVGFLVPALDFCFDQVGWRRDDVDVIGVDVGPGLFSGIRVGLSTAQALAGAIGAPLVPVTSLDAVALRARTGHRRIWAAVDARRGEFAVAPYRPLPGGVVRDGPVELVSPESFRGMLESDSSEKLLVGDWEGMPPTLVRGVHGLKLGQPRYPVADSVFEITSAHAERDEFLHPDEVRPRYLREPDVHINWSDFRREGRWSP